MEYFHLGVFVIPRVCLIRKYGSQTQAFFFSFFIDFSTPWTGFDCVVAFIRTNFVLKNARCALHTDALTALPFVVPLNAEQQSKIITFHSKKKIKIKFSKITEFNHWLSCRQSIEQPIWRCITKRMPSSATGL